MTVTHYIGIPIALTKEDVSDLIALDAQHTDTISWKPLQTLSDLNSQIISQLANFCAQHQTVDHLPISITATPMLPLTHGADHGK